MSTRPAGPFTTPPRWRERLQTVDLLRIAVHVGALLPAIWILAAVARGDLTANPYQAVEQRTGRTALILLVISLACTPANLLFGWRWALRHRRTLGLYAFAYASAHLLVLVGVDYQFAFRLLRADLTGKPFIWVGAAALMVLAALAGTSFPAWKKRLGKNWKRLHRLAYLAVLLVVVHYVWARKGNLTSLSGDILKPLGFGLVALGLLFLRIPVIRRWIARRGHGTPGETIDARSSEQVAGGR
jgi:sulfoxide reductase heme-binding subunit YedZ